MLLNVYMDVKNVEGFNNVSLQYLNLYTMYWMLSSDQIITTMFYDGNITTHQLIVNNINNSNLEKFFYGLDLKHGLDIYLLFQMTVTINYSILFSTINNMNTLLSINQNSIKSMDNIKICSSYSFGFLIVQNINTDSSYNNNWIRKGNYLTNLTDFFLLESNRKIMNISFVKLYTTAFISIMINTSEILKSFNPILMKANVKLIFLDLKAKKIEFLKEIQRFEKLKYMLCKNLHIRKQTEMNINLKVDLINEHNDNYLKILLSSDELLSQIGGVKHFHTNIALKKQISARKLNNVKHSLGKTQNILVRGSEAIYIRKWIFKQAFIFHFQANILDNIDTHSFIMDFYSRDIQLSSNIKMFKVDVYKLIAWKGRDLGIELQSESMLSRQLVWKRLQIIKSTYLSCYEENILYKLMWNSVLRAQNQVVKGKITMLQPVFINYLSSLMNIQKSITKLVFEALQKSFNKQIIFDMFYLQSSIIVERNCENNKNISFKHININSIYNLWNSVYNLKSVIFNVSGRKHFSIPVIFDFFYKNNKIKTTTEITQTFNYSNQQLFFQNGLIASHLHLQYINVINFENYLIVQLEANDNTLIDYLEIDSIKSRIAQAKCLNNILNGDWVINEISNKLFFEYISGSKYIGYIITIKANLNTFLLNQINFENILSETVLLDKPFDVLNIFLPNLMVKRGLTVINEINGGTFQSVSKTIFPKQNLKIQPFIIDQFMKMQNQIRDIFIIYFEQSKTSTANVSQFMMKQIPIIPHEINLNTNNISINITSNFHNSNVTIEWQFPKRNSIHHQFTDVSRIYNAMILNYNVLFIKEKSLDVLKIDENYNYVIHLQTISLPSYRHIIAIDSSTKYYILIINSTKAVSILIMGVNSKFNLIQEISGQFDIIFGISSMRFKNYIIILSRMMSREIYIFNNSLRKHHLLKLFQFLEVKYNIKSIVVFKNQGKSFFLNFSQSS